VTPQKKNRAEHDSNNLVLWKIVLFTGFQVRQNHEFIPLSILGCDQQNLENFLCDFKWSRDRLAHVFADGWSTASHKRKMTLWEAPTGRLLFYHEDFKQEIVHALLLEEYGASTK